MDLKFLFATRSLSASYYGILGISKREVEEKYPSTEQIY